MLYQGERNYGCRFMEYVLMGLRTVTLENEKLRVTMLVDKGTEIIEFNYKEFDTDFVWRSPLGLSCLRQMVNSPKNEQMLTDWYTGGWFECFPNVGLPCTYKGAHLPQYGELWYLPWEYTVLKDEPEEVKLKFYIKTIKSPFKVVKEISLKSGESTLYINKSIENLGREEFDYQWGFHPNFGANFIDDSCIIDMPEAKVKVHYSVQGSSFEAGAAGEWPFITCKDGTKYDLRKVSGEKTGINYIIDVNYLKSGMTAIRNINKKLGLEMTWDVNTFPHNVIWHISNGDVDYPRYGNTYVLGFLPRNDTVWDLEASAISGNCPKIKPGEKKSTWFNINVFKL